MLKTIIFDFDGMLHHSPGLFSELITERYGITKDQVSEFFEKDYNDCKLGLKDTKEALVPYLEKWGFPDDVDTFLKIWHDYGYFDEEMFELIKELQSKGIKCFLATNNERYRMEAYAGRLKIFDEVICSFEHGFMKPGKEMLDLIAEKAGCEKDEVLFCDDKEDTIERVEEYGFRGYLYEDIEDFRIVLGMKAI